MKQGITKIDDLVIVNIRIEEWEFFNGFTKPDYSIKGVHLPCYTSQLYTSQLSSSMGEVYIRELTGRANRLLLADKKSWQCTCCEKFVPKQVRIIAIMKDIYQIM